VVHPLVEDTLRRGESIISGMGGTSRTGSFPREVLLGRTQRWSPPPDTLLLTTERLVLVRQSRDTRLWMSHVELDATRWARRSGFGAIRIGYGHGATLTFAGPLLDNNLHRFLPLLRTAAAIPSGDSAEPSPELLAAQVGARRARRV
jgi:hypothetical protein